MKPLAIRLGEQTAHSKSLLIPSPLSQVGEGMDGIACFIMDM
ncbi:MAG: hypothetical protein R8K20_08880 [Gallionellaceae bacterium]